MTKKPTPPTTTHGRPEWAASIRDLWTQVAESFLATGRELIDAKATLPHGDFEAMVADDLPFGRRTAQRLMAVAGDKRLANATSASLLPASWDTLYALTRLSDEALSGGFDDGEISSDMTLGDVKRIAAKADAGDRGGVVDSAQCALEDLHDFAISRAGHFGALLLDPPWTFETRSDKGKDRSPEKHYPCMKDDEIAELPIKELAAANCVLFLWTTWPKLEDALWILPKWGFVYRTMGFTWVKQRPQGGGMWKGMGFWTRSNPEPCILATRGKPKRLPSGTDVEELVVAPVREHSRKPAVVRARITALVDGPYLELFARERAKGWDAWGTEVGKFDQVDDPVGDKESRMTR